MRFKHKILEKMVKRSQQFRNNNSFRILKNVEQYAIQNQAKFREFRKGFKEILKRVKDKLARVEEQVNPSERVFRKGLPLRDAATNTIYFQLMNQPRGRRMRIVEYSVFRIAITLLRFTALRINEIRTFNKEQYLHLIEEGRIQIHQSKQNKDRTILLSNGATTALNKLKAEAISVFCKRETLAGGASSSS